jgi:hypothetical protein
MASDRGVTCPHCGASTPLPEDLRTPTFQCAFCKSVLETARFAGQAAVSADAVIGYMSEAIAAKRVPDADSIATAPRFEEENAATRPAACLACGAPVQVPLNLRVHHLTCGACGRSQPVNGYISDQERFELDMARQAAGNDALKRLQADGLSCTKCGGKNPLPADGSIQLPCKFCGATILLADHVDAGAVARQRLVHNVFAMKDELMRQQEARDRRNRYGAIALVVVLALIAVAVNVVPRIAGMLMR